MVTQAQFTQVTHIHLPTKYSYKKSQQGLEVAAVEAKGTIVPATLTPFRSRGPNFQRFTATTPDGRVIGVNFGSTIVDFSSTNASTIIRGSNLEVEGHVLRCDTGRFLDIPYDLEEGTRKQQSVRAGWRMGIQYNSELPAIDGALGRSGLRLPQMGALHAIAAHWSLSKEPAIVVMPTGTGKTEVMLALSVESYGARVLVVVPTDALRQQTADKYREYGLLRQLGIIGDIENPVVGALTGKPLVEQFPLLRTCNIVVTTMSSIARSDEGTQQQFAELFTEVFFDEAHHMQAQTWKKFGAYCKHARTVLFTATPFREDGKALPGKIIYNFPLQSAQEHGFFRPIRFIQVFEPNSELANSQIAAAAVAKLREDLAANLDHMLLARAGTIDEAEDLYRLVYEPQYSDLNPVVIHSHSPSRANILRDIRNRIHRIIICVDMFGEGYDLPNLKIAALHSVHKSLGITLQFIGRFARSNANVGDASFVANTAGARDFCAEH